MQRLIDVMGHNLQVISPEATLQQVAVRIGAATDRDIAMRAVAEGKGVDTLVRELMSKDVIWGYEDDTRETGAGMTSRCQIRRLPVANRAKRLVGIVSLGDFAVAAHLGRSLGRHLAVVGFGRKVVGRFS